MPTFARSGSGSGKWHLVGPDGCRYGREFDADDATPDDTVTAIDIVAYDTPGEPAAAPTGPISPPTSGSMRGRSDQQRLVFPVAIRDGDADLCGSCRAELERQQQRRARVIADLKRVTTRRDIDWDRTDRETRRACDWCRAHERTTYDGLGATVCPVCRRLFESPLGEPSDDRRPDTDRLPETPTDPIAPIVLETDLPDYEPTELVGSNRPVITYREKRTYAEVIFELERTGHGFSAEGIAELESVRTEYADRVATEDTHQAEVTLEIGTTPRTVTLENVLPADRVDVIDACWDVVSDPSYWFPLGWPQQGYVHRRGAVPSIPGDDPVVEEFPRLRTRKASSAVDTDTLRSVTDPGRYERGERYYERGAVTDAVRVDERLRATVQGSQPYEVQVTLSNGSYVEGECSCPDDTVPCKHIVAAVLASGDVEDIGADRSLEAVLESATPDEVRTLLRNLAEEDVSVRKRVYETLEK
ncbi:SWIM zinc finger [Halobiforma haloterrestris]|uniref:SWIM zinc finger n=1 Tax=Natronobacterium haloterrestre TaxID=148448 RepID=A0A1I1KGJ8_NATHA|nr:SWIM zinc finger family protein [Halobiforma haloterrestris]SFC59392.1 SWIM zinc finger [Halobiforma haloterrestris]